MRLRNITEIHDFEAAVKKCKGVVQLTSPQGDIYNLNSDFSRYVALGALLSERGDELELWCSYHPDEQYFLNFFNEHPETLKGDKK